jgi:DDE domain
MSGEDRRSLATCLQPVGAERVIQVSSHQHGDQTNQTPHQPIQDNNSTRRSSTADQHTSSTGQDTASSIRAPQDHSRLKARLRPMRGLKTLRSAQVVSAGHAFIQNIRRGHYEPGIEASVNKRLPAAFAELTLAI